MVNVVVLTAAFFAFEPDVIGKGWERLDGCQLVPMSFNDGDSFLVRQAGREIVVRLYSVDCAETSNLFPERIKDQADYFGISRERTLELGRAASSYVARRLASMGEEGFTIYTRWEDGWGQKKRYLAVVELGDRTLAEILAEEGLVRIYGLKNPGDWPGGPSAEALRSRLNSAEDRAKAHKIGGWGDDSAEAIAARGGEGGEAHVITNLNRDQAESGKPLAERLNVNEADLEELERLPGIGETLAGRVVAGRPYWSVADLRHVEGIGDLTVATLSPLVTVLSLNAPRGTADYFRLTPERFHNREVLVFITALEEINLPAPDGFAVMRARTARGGEVGGAMEIFFPEEQREQVESFFSEGQASQTRAVYYNYQGEDVLVVPRRAAPSDGSRDEASSRE